MKKLILCALTLCAQICAMAQGQTFASSLVAKDPETLATAGVSMLSSDNIAWSSFGGAAMMPFHQGKLDAGASYSTLGALSPGKRRVALSAGAPVSDRIAVALGIANLGGDSYEIFDDQGLSGGMFTAFGMLASAGVAVKAGQSLGIGANVKYAQESLYSGAPAISSVMADLSLAYHKNGLSVLASLTSLGGGVKGESGDSYPTPSYLNAGVYYDLTFAEVHKLGLGALADVFFAGSFGASAGTSYSFKDMLFLRAGFHYSTGEAPLPTYAGLGAGVKVYGVRIDFSYNTMLESGNSGLCLSLGYSF